MKHCSPTYHLNPVVTIEDFGERSLVLHCEDLRMTELNATASDLLRRLDGRINVEQVTAVFAEEHCQATREKQTRTLPAAG